MAGAKQHRHSVLSLILMLVMTFNIAGTTLFVHSHNIDGVSIVHSHPYTGIPTSHSHTSSHASLIARLAAMDILLAEPLTMSASCLELQRDSRYAEIHFSNVWSAAQQQLRAPPVAIA